MIIARPTGWLFCCPRKNPRQTRVGLGRRHPRRARHAVTQPPTHCDLCRATAKAVEGHGSHGPGHERHTDARSESMSRGHDRVPASECDGSSSGLSGESDLGKEGIQGTPEIDVANCISSPRSVGFVVPARCSFRPDGHEGAASSGESSGPVGP